MQQLSPIRTPRVAVNTIRTLTLLLTTADFTDQNQKVFFGESLRLLLQFVPLPSDFATPDQMKILKDQLKKMREELRKIEKYSRGTAIFGSVAIASSIALIAIGVIGGSKLLKDRAYIISLCLCAALIIITAALYIHTKKLTEHPQHPTGFVTNTSLLAGNHSDAIANLSAILNIIKVGQTKGVLSADPQPEPQDQIQMPLLTRTSSRD